MEDGVAQRNKLIDDREQNLQKQKSQMIKQAANLQQLKNEQRLQEMIKKKEIYTYNV